MPEMKKYSFTCPHCGKANLISLPESINAQADPAEKQRLLEGSLFVDLGGCVEETSRIVYITISSVTGISLAVSRMRSNSAPSTTPSATSSMVFWVIRTISFISSSVGYRIRSLNIKRSTCASGSA